MKKIERMSQAELAAYVQDHLRKAGIEVVLSGGAAVGIYSNGAYISRDIDLVNVRFTARGKMEKAMKELGFSQYGRHFEHPDSDHIVEFPPGPLIIGDLNVKDISELRFDTGILRVISPTDCIKDRLAHYFHWGDRQCLAQAEMVASRNEIDLDEIQDWTKSEGKLDELKKIRNRLEKA